MGEKVKTGKILLAFDEISWMGSKDQMFLSYIKNFWDQHLKTNDQLIFVVCGSIFSNRVIPTSSFTTHAANKFISLN